MVSREDFMAYLEFVVTKSDMKEARAKIKKRLIWSISFIIIAVAGVILSIVNAFYLGLFLSACPLIIGLILLFARHTKGYNSIINSYKSIVVDYALQGEKFEYNKYGVINKLIYGEAQLPSGYDDYHGEDLLSIAIPDNDGNPTDTKLFISDVTTTKTERDEEGRLSTYNYYDGVLGYIEFPFRFNCTLTINRSDYKTPTRMGNVKLESIDFDNIYKVKTDNQIEARYILTTDLMQKLIQLAMRAFNPGFVLVRNKMFITFPHNHLFESYDRNKKFDGTIFKPFYDDIEMLMGIVKEIQRNDKIFKID